MRTYRAGAARNLGHDLVIEVAQWQAQIEMAADGSMSSVVFQADPSSLHAREGNGLKPLDDGDRAVIRKNIDEQVLRGRAIEFRSTEVEQVDGHLRVNGNLTLSGTTSPATFELAVTPEGRVQGTLPLKQSQWDITPFSHPVLPLKLRDDIEVAVDIALPSSSPGHRR